MRIESLDFNNERLDKFCTVFSGLDVIGNPDRFFAPIDCVENFRSIVSADRIELIKQGVVFKFLPSCAAHTQDTDKLTLCIRTDLTAFPGFSINIRVLEMLQCGNKVIDLLDKAVCFSAEMIGDSFSKYANNNTGKGGNNFCHSVEILLSTENIKQTEDKHFGSIFTGFEIRSGGYSGNHSGLRGDNICVVPGFVKNSEKKTLKMLEKSRFCSTLLTEPEKLYKQRMLSVKNGNFQTISFDAFMGSRSAACRGATVCVFFSFVSPFSLCLKNAKEKIKQKVLTNRRQRYV